MEMQINYNSNFIDMENINSILIHCRSMQTRNNALEILLKSNTKIILDVGRLEYGVTILMLGAQNMLSNPKCSWAAESCYG